MADLLSEQTLICVVVVAIYMLLSVYLEKWKVTSK